MELNVNVSVKQGKINAVPRLSTWNNGSELFNSELAKTELQLLSDFEQQLQLLVDKINQRPATVSQ